MEKLRKIGIVAGKFVAACFLVAFFVTALSAASSYTAGTLPGGLTIGQRTFFAAEFAAIDTALDTIAAGGFDVGAIAAADIATGAVGTLEVLDGDLTTLDLSSSANLLSGQIHSLAGNKLQGYLAGSMINTDVAATAAIQYTKLLFSDNIVAGDIATGAVGLLELADDAADRTALDFVLAFTVTPGTASTIAIVNSESATTTSGTVAGTVTDPNGAARNLTITWHDGEGVLTGCVVTVVGTDAGGAAVSEALALAAFASGLATTTGTKIFDDVTGVTWATCSGAGGGETLSVGAGVIIGLPDDITATGAIKSVRCAGVRAASPTIAVGDQTSGITAGAACGSTSAGVLAVVYNPGN